LVYVGEKVPLDKFKSYADFFSTGTGSDGANRAGIGLANYSNRSFFTAGTNIGQTLLPSPSPIGVGLTAELIYPSGSTWWQVSGAMIVLKGNVTDNLDPTPAGTSSAILTSAGAWDQFLKPTALPSRTINYLTYNDMARLLLPRAGSYSVGFINHFFRGRMTIAPPKEGVYGVIDQAKTPVTNATTDYKGFNVIKLQLSAPPTDNNDQPQSLAGGVLTAVFKFKRNKCYNTLVELNEYPSDSSDSGNCRLAEEEVVVSSPANGGNPVQVAATPETYTFEFANALPINATDVRLQVLYKGYLNSEQDAIVVATEDLSEPAFVSYLNTTDYFAIAGKVYTIAEISGNQTLINKLTVCVKTENGNKTLIPDCLKPRDVKVDMAIGPEGNQVTLAHDKLEPKKFVRFSILKSAVGNTTIRQMPTGTCHPLDDIQVVPYYWQNNYTYPSTTSSDYSKMLSVRGDIHWTWISCVNNGDGSTPGTPDNRSEIFKAMATKELMLTEILINGGEGFK
jgi:hypothetical protein